MNGKGSLSNSVQSSETYWPYAMYMCVYIYKYMLGQIQTNMEHLTWFLKCGNPPCVNVFLLFFQFDRPSLDKDRPAKFEFFDFKFTRSLAEMILFIFFLTESMRCILTYWARWAWLSWSAGRPPWPDTRTGSRQTVERWRSQGCTGQCPESAAHGTWARLQETHSGLQSKRMTRGEKNCHSALTL